MKELIGKTIESAWTDQVHERLAFVCTDGTIFHYTTEAECCSSTWIQHVENAEYLIGGTVLDWEEVDMPRPEDADSYDVIKCYGVRLTLEDRPPFFFEFRNASNGYYSGSIDGGLVSKLPQDLIPLTEDF